MRIEQIITKLTDSFEIDPGHIKDVREYLTSCSEPERLVQLVKLEYTYSRPLRVSDVHTIAKNNRLAGSLAGKSKKVTYYECQKCGLTYSMRGRGCVKCKKMTPIKVHVGNSYPESFVRANPDCYCCEIYDDKVIGTSCEFWGKDVVFTGDQLQICRDCQCRNCCKEERILNAKAKKNTSKWGINE